jgi:aerobic C4-dicarboxylate transport protein
LTVATAKRSFFRTLYFRVLAGVILGVAVGIFWPHTAAAMKPFGDAFIKLVKMMVAPIIFLSVVIGIANVGDLHKLGRIGIKALIYFEVVSTLALLLGMVVATAVQPGRGMNVDVRSLDVKEIQQYTSKTETLGAADFLLNIIPDTFIGAFSKGEILQVLFLAILTGMTLVMLPSENRILRGAQSVNKLCFKMIGIIMETAPLGAFGAMAFTVGRYGVATLISLGKLLLCVYLTSIGFVAVVLGAICMLNGINIWRFVLYLREELLIVLATSSSEPALPALLVKMENLGCSRVVSGLVIPAGYSFNLDGTSIYLTVATLFIAQATNTHLTFAQQAFILFVLMLNSKGAATVTGGGFITLAGTLSMLGTPPVAGITLLLGVDRFMSEMRSLTNIIGNGVATILVAKWEGEFDAERAQLVLKGHANNSLEKLEV